MLISRTLPLLFYTGLIIASTSVEAACVWGNCSNGIGRFEYNSGNYNIAQYKNGKREGYGVWSNKAGTSQCEGLNQRGKREGLWVCRSLLGERYINLFTYYDAGESQHFDDLAIYLNDAGEVIRYSSPSDSPSVDFDRLVNDYQSIREASLGQLRLNLSEEFREVALPSRQQLSRYEGRISERENKSKIDRAADSSGAEKTYYCKSGDCDNGFGNYFHRKEREDIGFWRDSELHGYAISKFVHLKQYGTGLVCEASFQQGKLNGLRVCLAPNGTQTFSYNVNGVSQGDYLQIGADGSALRFGRYEEGKFGETTPVDTEKMGEDWEKLKNSINSKMRASFLPKRFLELSPPPTRGYFVKGFENSKNKAPKSAIVSKPNAKKAGECTFGDCQNGFGKRQIGDSEFIGRFTDGELFGYGLVLSDGAICQAYMIETQFSGVTHCYVGAANQHVLRTMKGKVPQREQVLISIRGELSGYTVYENGKQVVSNRSEREKRRRMEQVVDSLIGQLNNARRSAPPEISNWIPEELQSIPKRELASIPRRETKKKPATRSIPVRPPETVSPIAKKQQSDLAKLSRIVAELNATSRQINPDYRLDRVRLDTETKTLVYEFTALKSISSLNTSIITVANKTAYCRSSKLQPFRQQNMAALWKYVDRDEKTFEVLTKPEQC